LNLCLKNGQSSEAGRIQQIFRPPRNFVTRLVHRFGGFVSP
jgi:hypothetical protein